MTSNITAESPPHHPDVLKSSSDDRTLLVHGGRQPGRFSGMVNTPVHRGSTILASSLEEWERWKAPENGTSRYGRFGTPTTHSFQDLIAKLEGGHRSIVFPSGLSACTHTLLSFLQAGDHILMTDSVYGPVRSFATQVLKRFGIEVGFFDPLIGSGIGALIRPNTRVVYVESPGSWTFEVQDIPAIAEQAHRAKATVVMDNTWASPLFFKPFEHGVDVSIQAATKYIVGHSDAFLGVATGTRESWERLQKGSHDFGEIAGPDDIYLALRGLRSMDVRLARHWENGAVLAESLREHKLVHSVLHPALPEHPGHALWKRDFRGASGLFGVQLHRLEPHVIKALFDRLQLFGVGFSWGGFESLAVPSEESIPGSARTWPHAGKIIRIHAGLESAEDLVADMRQAFRHAATLV
ncbi:cystathionine beta-lyase [Caenimonas soli]|uniref:cystathionine beta-lyase n=1 Tax=Caenimonas soli TaxID=2735555 RepID=UPI0015519617|nr:cystathionine beta-lyase [Caenimonas soli]NPC55633.1 cystathionine beta-lyase [Caenimonas soli]